MTSMKRTALVGLAIGLALVAAGCSGSGPTTSPNPSNQAGRPGGSGSGSERSPGPQPELQVRLVLPSTTVRSGSTLNGRLIVTNRTGHALRGTACGSPFQVLLENDRVEQQPAWLGCLARVTVRVGTSSWPVGVSAFYNTCGPGMKVHCAAGGHPPGLPPGSYETRFFQNGHLVPAPAPIRIVVTG